MHIRSFIAGLALVATIVATNCLHAASGSEPAFTFDGQKFFLRSTEGGIYEYLPANETFKNWTALISVREFTGTKNPKAYAQKLIDNAKDSSPKAQGMLMENSEAGSYIADFLLPDGEGDDAGWEWNLWRVEKKGDGVEAVQYALRIPTGSGLGADEIMAARKKLVPALAEFQVPGASGGESHSSGAADSGDVQTYAYPDADDPQFTMEVPGDWTLESDAKGAWIVSADKKFTTSVVVVPAGDVEDAVESIKKQSGSRFESIEWNEGVGKTNKSTGVTFRSVDGSAEDKGVQHKVGVYVFSKDGANKAFILSTWTPEAALANNAEGILKMLGSAKLY